MKLKVRQILEIYAALQMLDGYEKPVGKGDEQKTIRVSYQFSGKTRKKIARNMTQLRIEVDEFSTASDALFRQLSGGKETLDPNDKKEASQIGEFNRQKIEMMNEETDELKLKLFTDDEFDLDKNPIPGTVYAALLPLIEDTEGLTDDQ